MAGHCDRPRQRNTDTSVSRLSESAKIRTAHFDDCANQSKARVTDLAREKRALGHIRDTIRRSDTLGFLTDRRILPNYAFPEQGVTLRSILAISRCAHHSLSVRRRNRAGEGAVVTDYVRSASSALTEFAPSSSFYAEGRKLKINQVDLSASPIDHWRICPDCTHIAVAVGEMTDTLVPPVAPSCGRTRALEGL